MTADAFEFLTIPPSREVAEQALPICLRDWFARTIGAPTLAQRYAWPAIFGKQHLLLSAPTGSGKTLAAFLPIISQIAAAGPRRIGLPCLYVAPLKALCRDVRVNLRRAWRSMQQAGCFPDADLSIGLRTGDTSQRVRRRHLSDPPALLVTTPESLAQMLAHPASCDFLQSVRWIVIDEIHALLTSKRGADLAMSLERLPTDAQRIGLSATCAPLATVADFLVGNAGRKAVIASCPPPAADRLHLEIEPLFANSSAAPGWLAAVLDRLEADIVPGCTTMIFANTRGLAERLTWALKRRYPDRQAEIGVHHSAISPLRRRLVERRLKQGRLWIVVSSTSLELGIDIGAVDRVVFLHPPGGVARLLQRVGRSGHRPGEPRRGLLLTASLAELIECAVTTSGGRDGRIESARMIDAPLDVLCQQLVGMAMTGSWTATSAFELVRRAAPYRNLAWEDFQDCLDYLSGRRRDGSAWLPARLCWQGDAFTIADERTARLLRRNLGSIITEDACAVRLRTPTDNEPTRTQTVGEVDRAYAERLRPGDRFMLDGRCLECQRQTSEAVEVDEVFGRPLVPRWLGHGVPMSAELALRIYLFRAQAAEILRDGESALAEWLRSEFHLGDEAADVSVRFFQEQETVSETPPANAVLIESVAMQSCTEYFAHTPLPRAANEALVRVLLARLQLQASAVAANLGFYLIVHSSRPIAPDDWRRGLHGDGFADDLRASLEGGDLLRHHFAAIAQTGLMLLRNPAGRKRKVGGSDWAERRLFDQLRSCAPDFVLMRQAQRDAVETACDLASAGAFARQLRSLPIRVRRLAVPSPLGESLLGARLQGETITARPLEDARP